MSRCAKRLLHVVDAPGTQVSYGTHKKLGSPDLEDILECEGLLKYICSSVQQDSINTLISFFVSMEDG